MNKKFILIGLSCLISLLIAGWLPFAKTRENPRNCQHCDQGQQNPTQSGKIKNSGIPQVENRQVVIDYPKSVWVGDKDQIIMTLEYTTDDLADSANSQDFQEISTLYDIFIETRLDLPGIKLEPAVPVRAALVESQEMVFQWEIIPGRSGNFRGNLWLYLTLYPRDGNLEIEIPVLIFPIEISSAKVLGMPINVARIAGWMGIFLSSVMLVITVKRFDD